VSLICFFRERAVLANVWGSDRLGPGFRSVETPSRGDVETGAVDDFSPRDGGGNLIDTPRGIASSPEGEVYVTNYADGSLVKIDPATGAQSIVEFFWGGVGARWISESIPRASTWAWTPRPPAICATST
jgi:streptogramin lyase